MFPLFFLAFAGSQMPMEGANVTLCSTHLSWWPMIEVPDMQRKPSIPIPLIRIISIKKRVLRRFCDIEKAVDMSGF